MANTRGIRLEGKEAALARLKGLPKEANTDLRRKAKEAVSEELPRLQSAADSPQARLVSGAIRARSDRLPSIVAGSKKIVRKVGKKRVRARDIFFGAEFGGRKRKTTMQFRRHRGNKGYWFFPRLEKDSKRIGKKWLEVVESVERDWAGKEGEK